MPTPDVELAELTEIEQSDLPNSVFPVADMESGELEPRKITWGRMLSYIQAGSSIEVQYRTNSEAEWSSTAIEVGQYRWRNGSNASWSIEFDIPSENFYYILRSNVVTGEDDTYGLTLPNVSLRDGLTATWIARRNNEGRVYLTFNSSEQKELVDQNGARLYENSIRNGRLIQATYDAIDEVWRSNLFYTIDFDTKANVDLSNLPSDLTDEAKQTIQTKLGVGSGSGAGTVAYADNTAFTIYTQVHYQDKLYFYTSAIPADNTTKPDVDTRAVLIDQNTQILDVRNGFPTLPAPTAQNEPLYAKTIGLGTNGNFYEVEKIKTRSANDASGNWLIYVHANFLGVRGLTPFNPSAGEYYYDTTEHSWILFQNQPLGGLQPLRVDATEVLGQNAVWLSSRDSARDATHAIENFDATKTYYAEIGAEIDYLNNATYVAATDATYEYKWTLSGKSVRELVADLESRVDTLERSGSPTPTQPADVEGAEIARTGTLPTTAVEIGTALTTDWTIPSSPPAGVANAGGILRLPNKAPNDNVLGVMLIAYEGNTAGARADFPFGARSPSQESIAQSFSAIPIRFSNNGVILADYYHDGSDGDSIRLFGNNNSIPSNASIRAHWIVAGQGSGGGQSFPSAPGTSVVTPNIIQLTQWLYSPTQPAIPPTPNYDATLGRFTNFPSSGWAPSVPIGASAHPLWLATSLTIRHTDGTWHSQAWTIVNAGSSTIEFYNLVTQTWEDAPSANTSDIRIWEIGSGWRTIGVKSRHTLLAPTAVVENTDKMNVVNVRIADIDQLGFEIIRQNNRWYCDIPMNVVASDGADIPVDGSIPADQERNRFNSTITIKFGEDGYADAFITRANSGAVYHNSAYNGGVFLNLFKNASDELVTAKFAWTFGIASSGSPTVRIIAVT